MSIPYPSPTAQMQMAAADRALLDYFDPSTVDVGATVPYRDENDETDDRAWSDAEAKLRKRGLRLEDTGGGYTVVADD